MRQVPEVRIATLEEGTSLSRGGVSSLLQLKGRSLCFLLFLMKGARVSVCGCECKSESMVNGSGDREETREGELMKREGIWVLGEEMSEESAEGVGKKTEVSTRKKRKKVS